MTGINSLRWDKVYRDFNGKRFSVWKEDATPFFVEKIPFFKNNNVKKILDAGCGDGRNLQAFAKAGFQMTGIDSSREACKRAQRVLKNFPDTNVIEQDLKNLNVVGLFDAIICDYVLVHLEKAEKIIQLFLNALKTNGYLLIEFLSTDDPSCKRDENIRDNTLVSHGIFHKFYSTNEVEVLLSAFNILELRKIQHYDPDHVEDYPRSKNHKHDSIYVLCQKT